MIDLCFRDGNAYYNTVKCPTITTHMDIWTEDNTPGIVMRALRWGGGGGGGGGGVGGEGGGRGNESHLAA